MSRSERSATAKQHRTLLLSAAIVVGLLLVGVAPVWGSIFGEENSTLVQMLVQLLQIQKQMSDLNKVASQTADFANSLLRSYQEVNAGINELKSYSFDAFVNDLQVDLYRQYPGFGKLQYATQNLGNWQSTFASSPLTAYQAITQVVGDVSQPLRDDLNNGRRNIDRELLLKGEAAGGFAAAYTAEQVTEKFDKQIATLTQLAQHASPGEAAQLSARANLMVAAQQSYVMRLLARSVRLHSVDTSIEYGTRLDGLNAGYQQRDQTVKVANEALHPPPLIDFGSDSTAAPIDPYAPSSAAQPINPYPGAQ